MILMTNSEAKNFNFHKDCVSKIEDWTYEKFQSVVGRCEFIWYLEIKNKFAGFAGINGHRLGPCFVNQEFRGKGLQKKFIKARLKFAKGLSYCFVTSVTDPQNIYSSNNLIACGFKMMDYVKDRQEIIWERKIK